MKTATITLAGEEHLLCFSTGVLEAACDKYGSSEAFFAALQSERQVDKLRTVIWVLARMMDAGARYAKRRGIPTAPPLSEDDIRDLCGLAELAGLNAKVQESIMSGSQREVEAEPQKKEDAASEHLKVVP